MLVFLGTGLAYIGGWGAMYYSEVFRWTWVEWPFFACLTIISQVVLIASIVLGIICRKNFKKGLAQYCTSAKENLNISYGFTDKGLQISLCGRHTHRRGLRARLI